MKQNRKSPTLTYDDFIFWLTSPTINGSENPAENNWIYFIYDDFYFQDAQFSVSQSRDIAKNSVVINYADENRGTFDGEVNTKYRIIMGFK